MVSIAVENISEGKIDLKTIPAFTLNDMQYWCPVNIAGDDHSLPANARSNISLEKGARIDSRIDMSMLGWDQGLRPPPLRRLPRASQPAAPRRVEPGGSRPESRAHPKPPQASEARGGRRG